MKPTLKEYGDLVKAVDMIRTGKVRGAENVVRILVQCLCAVQASSPTVGVTCLAGPETSSAPRRMRAWRVVSARSLQMRERGAWVSAVR